jgi:cytochrome bd-type quinol oxidase subunit 1
MQVLGSSSETVGFVSGNIGSQPSEYLSRPPVSPLGWAFTITVFVGMVALLFAWRTYIATRRRLLHPLAASDERW